MSADIEAGSAPVATVAAVSISPRQRYRGLLWLVSASFFMQTLDATIVNTAVPSIAHALAVTPLSLKTALTSYVLTLAVCIPASAWLADRFGTRRVFAVSITVFTLGSLASGLAQSLPQLIAARVLQGLGGALLMPVGRYVLVRSFGKADFVWAISLVAIPGLLGPVMGPVLGGALSEFASWRLIFLVNVPVGLLGLWLNRREMPDYRGEQRPFDAIGFALFATGSGLLLVASDIAGTGDLGRAGLVALFGLGAALAYWRHGRRARYPIADLALLRVRSLAVALGGSLFTRLGVSGLAFVLVLFLQVGCGWSPFAAGLMLMPQALAMMLMKLAIDRLLKAFGYRRVLLVNTLLVAALLACFALLTPATSPLLTASLVFAYGLAMSLQYTAMNTLVFVDLEPEHAAMASSMTSTVQYLSISFGIALASLLMAAFLGSAHHRVQAYVSAFHGSVLLLALVTLVATLVFARLGADRPLQKLARGVAGND